MNKYISDFFSNSLKMAFGHENPVSLIILITILFLSLNKTLMFCLITISGDFWILIPHLMLLLSVEMM